MAQQPPRPTVELANVSPPAINPPDSLGLESQPVQTNSFTQKADGPPLIALQSEFSTVDKPQGIPASNGESESDPLGIIQPEPLADYSGSRFEPRDVAPVPHAGPASAALKGGATPPLPSNAGGTQSALSTLGYVEKAGGEEEAIVEVLGQIYLVHEGELFAEKYRALQVNPSSVQIVEESTGRSTLPAEPERDFEAVRPPIPRLRAPPLFMGSSGTDPPVEVREAEELAAGEPVSPSRPPPEHLIEFRQRLEGVKTPRTALESVRPAGRSAQVGTRSPYALKTVGFVEKASGETEAIVADEGGVYLVPGGRVSLDNPKIPRLFPAEPQSSRESIQSLLQGMPTTTFRLDTPQTQWAPTFAGVTRLGSIAPPSPCSLCPSARHFLAGEKSPGTGVAAAPSVVIPAQAGIHGEPPLSRGVTPAPPRP